MNVQITRQFRSAFRDGVTEERLEAGQILDVPGRVASKWVAKGVASLIDDVVFEAKDAGPPPENKDAGPPPETADDAPATRKRGGRRKPTTATTSGADSTVDITGGTVDVLTLGETTGALDPESE